jgi:hypothetical protein
VTEPLTLAQYAALARETDDAAGTFSHGLALLRRLHTSAHDSAAVFALLAVGAEKMLKLAIGLTAIEDGGAWPSKYHMQSQMGHRIVLLDQTARRNLARPRSHATALGYMSGAFDILDNDALLGPMLVALDSYASRGRFFNLDTLAGSSQQQPSPAEQWELVLNDILATDPDTLAKIVAPETYEQGRQALNHPIADSLQRWWQTHQRGWATGTLGRRAQSWASSLDLFDPTTRKPLTTTA